MWISPKTSGHTIAKNTLGTILLVVFFLYYGNSTLFWHKHYIDNSVFFHSHIYFNGSGENTETGTTAAAENARETKSVGHIHTYAQIQAISLLSLTLLLCSAVIAVVQPLKQYSLFLFPLPKYTHFKAVITGNPRRGPPACDHTF